MTNLPECSSTSPLTSPLFALLGVVIGAGAATASGFLIEGYKRHRDMQGAAAAMAGEIRSLMNVIRKGDLKKNLEIWFNILEIKDLEIPKFYTPEPAFGEIFAKSIDKLGLLPIDVVVRLVTLHGALLGFRAAMRNLVDGVWDQTENPRAAKSSQIKLLIGFLDQGERADGTLVPELLGLARSPWSPFRRHPRSLNQAVAAVIDEESK